MRDSEPSPDSDGVRLRKFRTGVRVVGGLCIATALALLILAPSTLRYCEGVIGVRLYILDRAAGIDYEAVKAAGEDNVHDTRSLIDWVVGDGLSAAYLLSHATTAGFALSGTACLVLAWRWGRTNA